MMPYVDEYGYLRDGEEWHEYEVYKNAPPVIVKGDGTDAVDLLTREAHCHTATGKCIKDRFGECEPTPIADRVAERMALGFMFINPNFPLTSVVNKFAASQDPEVAPLLEPREKQDWSEDTFADQLARGEHQ